MNKIKYRTFWYQYTSNDDCVESNEHLNTLVVMLIVVCLASVNCERGFSLMNIIKYWLSNRMRTELVDAILSIKDSGWTLNDEILLHEKKIINKFKANKKRRGEYNTKSS